MGVNESSNVYRRPFYPFLLCTSKIFFISIIFSAACTLSFLTFHDTEPLRNFQIRFIPLDPVFLCQLSRVAKSVVRFSFRRTYFRFVPSLCSTLWFPVQKLSGNNRNERGWLARVQDSHGHDGHVSLALCALHRAPRARARTYMCVWGKEG